MKYYYIFLLCFFGVYLAYGQRDKFGGKPEDKKKIDLGKGGKCTSGIIQPIFTMTYYDTLYNRININMLENVQSELKQCLISPVYKGFFDYHHAYPPEQLVVEQDRQRVVYLNSLIEWLPEEQIRDTIDTYSKTTISHVITCKSMPVHVRIQMRNGKLLKIVSLNKDNSNLLLINYWREEIEKCFSMNTFLLQALNNIDIDITGFFYHHTITSKYL